MQRPLEVEISEQKHQGVLLVVTGPSGSGKDTVIAKLLETHTTAKRVITTTTRAKREGESEGHPYHFISKSDFEQKIAAGDFFEWVEFRGALYGTESEALLPLLEKGTDLIWKIEAKGIKNIKEKITQSIPRSVFIFITASEVETMKERVREAEGESHMDERWNESLVIWERKQYEDCDYLVVNENGSLEKTVKTVESLLIAKRCEIIR